MNKAKARRKAFSLAHGFLIADQESGGVDDHIEAITDNEVDAEKVRAEFDKILYMLFRKSLSEPIRHEA